MNNSEKHIPGDDTAISEAAASGYGKFYDYYSRESLTPQALQRFRNILNTVVTVVESRNWPSRPLDIADVGCGAGTLSLMWAERGHHVRGLDINTSLLKLARERAASAGLTIDFREGSATTLPWEDESIDVCLMPELLEHVPDWQSVVRECARVLRPGGLLYLTTTNKLCPSQAEFNLPLYSWYPGPLKRYFEVLSVTRRPDLVNHAKYPAVNWFSFYSLRSHLSRLGFKVALDRFDILRHTTRNPFVQFTVSTIRLVPVLRWLAHVATPYTKIVALKDGVPPA